MLKFKQKKNLIKLNSIKFYENSENQTPIIFSEFVKLIFVFSVLHFLFYDFIYHF